MRDENFELSDKMTMHHASGEGLGLGLLDKPRSRQKLDRPASRASVPESILRINFGNEDMKDFESMINNGL